MTTTHTFTKGQDVLLDGKAGYTVIRPGLTQVRIREVATGASGLVPVDRVTPECFNRDDLFEEPKGWLYGFRV